MGENRNYIGIAMGLDVADLKQGLDIASKSIGKANADFNSATSGMDNWQKSVDGIRAKVIQLDDVLNAQKQKLAGLTAEYEKVAREQGENSAAAQNLYIRMKNQQAVVNSTEKELNNYKATLEGAENGTIDLEKVTIKGGKAVNKMGNEAKESGKSLDGLKSIAGGVAKGLAVVGGAAVAAIGSFLSLAESTREAREDMAKLTSAYEGAGMSTESAKQTFTDLFKVIGETDTAVEAAQQIALLAKSEEEAAKWAELATGVTATFGDALKPETFYEAANETLKLGEATGAFTQMLEGTGVSVEDFNSHLATLNTEEEKQAYLLEVSKKAMGEQGKAYEETAGSIMEAREAEAQLSLAMQELGEIAEPIMTELKLLAVDLLENITPFVQLIGEGLKGALDGTAGATDKLAEGIGGIVTALADKLVSAAPALIETIVSLFNSILPPLLTTISGAIPQVISTLASQLPLILQAILSGFSQLLSSIGSMLPQLIPVVIDAILMIVETLLDNLDMLIDSGISLLMGLADGLILALPRLIDKIPIILDKLISAISRNAPKLIQSGIELILKLAAGLIKAVPQLISKIPEIIASVVKGFSDYKDNMGEVGLNLVKGIWSGIKDGAEWLREKITGFADDVAGWFKKTFKINSPSKLMADEIGQYLGQGIGVGVIDSIPTVKKQLGKFSNFVSDNLGGIKSGLAVSANSGTVGGRAVGGSTVINAGMTINYNGNLSRRQLKQIENDNYNSIKMKLSREGAINV